MLAAVCEADDVSMVVCNIAAPVVYRHGTLANLLADTSHTPPAIAQAYFGAELGSCRRGIGWGRVRTQASRRCDSNACNVRYMNMYG